MAPLAATATSTSTDDIRTYALLLLVAIVVTAGYLLGCWLWPFGLCRRCKGTGKKRSPFGSAFGLCRRCDGTGRTLRIGRHVLNAIREAHSKGGK